MFRTMMRATLLCAALSCLATICDAPAARAAHPDLFYNYYVGRTACGAGQPVQLYVSPLPTPPYVGHTWITYPPLMPHEFLYHHHRAYYKYYRDGGWTCAKVHYH
jgi:hypothetical protein